MLMLMPAATMLSTIMLSTLVASVQSARHLVSVPNTGVEGNTVMLPACPMLYMYDLPPPPPSNVSSMLKKQQQQLCTCDVGTSHDIETNTCRLCQPGSACIRDRRLNILPACDGTTFACGCPQGQFVDHSLHLCLDCPSGYYSPFPDMAAAMCVECPEGNPHS